MARHFLACCGDGDLAGAQAIAAAADAKALGISCKQARRALRCACAGGFLPLAQWLAVEFGLGPAAMETERADLFGRACRNGHADMATWIVREFELSGTEVRAAAGRAVQRADEIGDREPLLIILGVCRAEFGVDLELEMSRAPKQIVTVPRADSEASHAERLNYMMHRGHYLRATRPLYPGSVSRVGYIGYELTPEGENAGMRKGRALAPPLEEMRRVGEAHEVESS